MDAVAKRPCPIRRRPAERRRLENRQRGARGAGATGQRPPDKIIAGFDNAADKLNTLLGVASDNSNLTLDPDIDSYYLMDAATTKLPTLANTIGEALAWAAKPETGQALTPAERDRLVELRPLISSALDGLNSDLAKAQAYNPAVKSALDADNQQLAPSTSCKWRL